MCETCGCSGESPHVHGPSLVELERDVLGRNARIAEATRQRLTERHILAVNLVSAPGAGKTTVLERTIKDLGRDASRDGTDVRPIQVIEGDQATTRDAERIRAAGARALQINTGKVCHLDAEMVACALEEMDPPARSVVMIENVGNLVCPALFDLGEHVRVVIVSVAEGDDKPIKYPHMFQSADLMLLNKVDLLPYVAFDPDRCLGDLRLVNPRLRVLPVSATRGDGLAAWYGWLRERAPAPGPDGPSRLTERYDRRSGPGPG